MAKVRNSKAKAEPTRLEIAVAEVAAATKGGVIEEMLRAGSELAAASAANDSEIAEAFTSKVKGILDKAKLEAPEGVTSLRINFDAENGITATIVKSRINNSAASSLRTGSGFMVSGPGVRDEFGSYSTAAKAVKLALGLHPSVNGKTFWKDHNNVSVKSHQESDPSWSARTGSVWSAGDYTLTVTR